MGTRLTIGLAAALGGCLPPIGASSTSPGTPSGTSAATPTPPVATSPPPVTTAPAPPAGRGQLSGEYGPADAFGWIEGEDEEARVGFAASPAGDLNGDGIE